MRLEIWNNEKNRIKIEFQQILLAEQMNEKESPDECEYIPYFKFKCVQSSDRRVASKRSGHRAVCNDENLWASTLA